MTYRITYTTDTRPADLPEGATVEKVSELPVQYPRDDDEPFLFALEASLRFGTMAYVSIAGNGRYLTRSQTRQVRDALNELLGEEIHPLFAEPEWDGYSEPPADVVETEDKDGDHWYRADDGNWSVHGEKIYGHGWKEAAHYYAPHTIVRRRGSDG